MTETYKITLKKEVLREFAASILSSYARFFDNNKIDWKNNTHLLVKLDNEVLDLQNSILRKETLDELKQIENRLKELKDIITQEEKINCNKKKRWLSIPIKNLKVSS